ncbi:MAG TPA: hypothetical protein PKO15_17210 [Fibrobacteria bacterium]|nr:hypothetical protein [Fibrobacteria bacterium]HOX52119.1 hypothetical protein [Fibrobacteria bacterium]
MTPRTAPFALAALLALYGCFEERSAGTSTETENAISARLIRGDSIFPPSEAFPGETVVATLQLDSTVVDFSRTRPDAKDLEVVRMDGQAIPFEVNFWDREHSRGRVQVRLEPMMRMHGSHFWLRWGLPPAERQSTEQLWSGIPDNRRLAWNSVLVDDFETGSTLHNRLPDSSFWYFGPKFLPSGLVSPGSDGKGSSLHLACLTGQCDTGRSIFTATMLAATRRSLRGLDSVELWARGSGNLWVTFESLDSVQMGRMSRGQIDSIQPMRCWAPRQLSSTWQRVVVRPSDFLAPDGNRGNVGWDAVRDSINYLVFLMDGGSEFWIDDIRLHGVLRQELQ